MRRLCGLDGVVLCNKTWLGVCASKVHDAACVRVRCAVCRAAEAHSRVGCRRDVLQA